MRSPAASRPHLGCIATVSWRVSQAGNVSDELKPRFEQMCDTLFAHGTTIYRGCAMRRRLLLRIPSYPSAVRRFPVHMLSPLAAHVSRGPRRYVDDPRNTDNAWMETVAMHFHCDAELGAMLPLRAGVHAPLANSRMTGSLTHVRTPTYLPYQATTRRTSRGSISTRTSRDTATCTPAIVSGLSASRRRSARKCRSRRASQRLCRSRRRRTARRSRPSRRTLGWRSRRRRRHRRVWTWRRWARSRTRAASSMWFIR